MEGTVKRFWEPRERTQRALKTSTKNEMAGSPVRLEQMCLCLRFIPSDCPGDKMNGVTLDQILSLSWLQFLRPVKVIIS